jgi:hypothetical protein
MTRGEMALPGRVVAEQELFFITLGVARWPMTSPVGMTRGEGWLRLELLRDVRNRRFPRFATLRG